MPGCDKGLDSCWQCKEGSWGWGWQGNPMGVLKVGSIPREGVATGTGMACHGGPTQEAGVGSRRVSLIQASDADSSLTKKFFSKLLINFWLGWVFAAVHGFSLAGASRGYSVLWGPGFSLRRFSCCGAQVQCSYGAWA